MPKVAVHSLGCRLNYAEINEIADQFLARGVDIVPFTDQADLYIINGCAVTQSAEKKTRQTLHKAQRRGKTLITGCSNDPDLKNQLFYEPDKEKIVPTALSLLGLPDTPRNIFEHYYDYQDRTRAFIKVQDSCNRFCTYCIIPFLRGPVRSIPYEKIKERIEHKLQSGYKEIVLTGVNIHLYNDNGLTIEGLFQKLLAETSVKRFRLGSLDPFLMTDEFIKTFHTPRFMPHVHLALQSGSDIILKKMNRRYTAEQYTTMIEKFRQTNPLFNITTDIIVGFPGETESDFEATKKMMHTIGFSKSHIFPYSPREGTPATRFKDNVPHHIKKERASQLREIDIELQNKASQNILNTTQSVLWEHPKDNIWHGFTPNYVKIQSKNKPPEPNKIKDTKITQENIIMI